MATLFAVGGLLFLIGAALSLSATSIFVAIFFAGLMAVGASALVGATVISALRR